LGRYGGRAVEGRLVATTDHETQELTVRAGEVLVIPSNLPHRALALEDTLDVDVFNPPRQDWLSGSDAYLRR
jgi:quercetin dioxygenase-like cupin family protein